MTPDERAHLFYLAGIVSNPQLLKAIADAIRVSIEEEREACAQIAERPPQPGENFDRATGRAIATEIRGRTLNPSLPPTLTDLGQRG